MRLHQEPTDASAWAACMDALASILTWLGGAMGLVMVLAALIVVVLAWLSSPPD